MRAQERVWPYQKGVPAPPRQRPAQRRKQHPVLRPEPRLTDLPAKDRQLVPEHKNLQLLRTITAPDENDQLQQPADDDVQG
jgi:hypothetical protein